MPAVDIFGLKLPILGTNLGSDGTITVITGDVINGRVIDDTTELWQHAGFVSRPSLATQGKDSAQTITIKGTNRDISIAERDLRGQMIWGNLNNGETCIYAGGADGNGAARVILKETGDIYLHTSTDSSVDGLGTYFKIGPSGLKYVSPYGFLIFDQTGFHAITSFGARLDLGSGGPTVIAGGKAELYAGVVSCKAPIVKLGPDTLNGGLGYFPAAYGLIPGPKFTPVLGEGVGAVVVNASASTTVMITP